MRKLAILTVLLGGTAGAVELTTADFVPNYGPMCAWAALETIGRARGIHELDKLVGYRWHNRRSEPATDAAIAAELQSRGVPFLLKRQLTRDLSLLEKYADSHGVVVAFKTNSQWSRMCHAVLVTQFDAEHVTFYCSDVRANRDKVPGIWQVSRAWFERNWQGGSLVVFRPQEVAAVEQSE